MFFALIALVVVTVVFGPQAWAMCWETAVAEGVGLRDLFLAKE